MVGGAGGVSCRWCQLSIVSVVTVVDGADSADGAVVDGVAVDGVVDDAVGVVCRWRRNRLCRCGVQVSTNGVGVCLWCHCSMGDVDE